LISSLHRFRLGDVPARGRHRWSLPIGPQRRIRVAQLSPKRGPGPAHRSGPGQGGPPARPRESSARLRRGRLKVYHGADRRNVLHFTESWRARASPSARPMRVARQNSASAFLSRRGYHLTRRSSRRTDGRRKSDGEAPRPSATREGCIGRRPLPAPRSFHHRLRGRPAVHPVGFSSSRLSSRSMPSRITPPTVRGRIWNFSEDLKAQIRAPVAPEILDENDTPGRPKESCTSEPGARMGPKTIRGHPPHARHPSRP
jgi:hypothetical protein